MAGREDEAQRKEERLKQSERAEPVTAGPRLEQAGAETSQESRRGSETASKSQPAPQEPSSWGLGGKMSSVPRRRGEERPRGRKAGRWRAQGRPLVGEGICRSGEQGNAGPPTRSQ